MSLSQLMDYETIDLFKIKDDGISLMEINEIKEKVKELAQKYIGGAVIINFNNRLPIWYYFLFFNELIKECTEVVIKIDNDQQVLLYTIYKEDEYVRPFEVLVYKEFLEAIKIEKENEKEIIIKLDDLDDSALSKNIDEIVKFLKKKISFCEKLILKNTTENYAGLMIYAFSRFYTNNVEYYVNDTIILKID